MEDALSAHAVEARRPLGRGICSLLLMWALSVCAGMCFLVAYSFGGGALARPRLAHWPEGTGITPEPGVATLVVALHPKCPCSRATVAELSRLLTHAPSAVRTHILVVRPTGAPEGFEHTDLWRTAGTIPGASLRVDPGGRVAALFGAQSSGHVVLFDEHGLLRFEGGITAARGHEGGSDGQDAILAVLAHDPARARAPAFGCRLRDPEPESAR